ncbi:kinetochore Sim4 complex subunit FTA2-domain-containing protein [Xylariaceae sp. FL1272]|nr:kinetochore Sim4 complex subunit FTA2-domain-containing protein [Xylariaceae sp. FL1272]
MSEVDRNWRLLSLPELPECEGPKLKAFPYPSSHITWLQWINQKEDASQSGGQGYVFKVKIRSRVYALKVFKFFDYSTNRPVLGPIRGRTVTDSELEFHTDPFYAECRAYGQIEVQRKRQGLKRKDIADCYGFLALKTTDENILKDYGIDLWRDIHVDDEYRQRAEGSPIRALVKEYVEEDVEFDERTRKRMMTSIKWMNRNNILINDIHAQNFKNGYLLDFGLSWTKPHCLWRNTSRQNMKAVLTVDLVMLKEMNEDDGNPLRRSSRLKKY